MERNFEVLELGAWYVRRDGAVVQVGPHTTEDAACKKYFPLWAADQYYDESGCLYGSIDSGKDLMIKVDPVMVKACKKTRMVPYGIVLFETQEETVFEAQGRVFTSICPMTERSFTDNNDKCRFIRHVDLPEIPITMVAEEVGDE